MIVEGYINRFSEHMETRIEPKDFQIEHWEKDTIEKLYQDGLIGFLQKFNGHNESIKREFIEKTNKRKLWWET